MKLFLVKILLQRRARDEGFTLPIVIALGLVMILLGAVNITSANEENLNAITQNSRSDALAIAEIGVARYRELLDKNRILALYDERPPTATEVSNSIDTQQWGDRTDVCSSNIASFLLDQENTISITEDGIDLNYNGDTDDTFRRGSYELISYDYSNADGALDLTDDALNSNARGELVVKGNATDENGNVLNSAQIKVDIPIRINIRDMGNLAPALWIGDDTVTAAELGDLTVTNGNVVLQDTAVTTGTTADGCGDFTALENATGTGLNIISDPRAIPSIQPIINTITAAENASGGDRTNALPSTADNTNAVGNTGATAYGEPPNGQTFNAARDCPTIRDCRYYYKSGALTIDNNLTTDGIARATLYINGALDIRPSGGNIRIGSSVASNYFEIYVDNNQAITIDTTNGDVTIDGFIHAPGSTLSVTGTGTVTIRGSVWVNDFVNTSATVNISPDRSNLSTAVSNMAYEFYTTTPNRTARPITGSPENWRTEEVN